MKRGEGVAMRYDPGLGIDVCVRARWSEGRKWDFHVLVVVPIRLSSLEPRSGLETQA